MIIFLSKTGSILGIIQNEKKFLIFPQFVRFNGYAERINMPKKDKNVKMNANV
jgi:hypothetical protein